MENATDIVNTLGGREAVAACIGVSPHAVRMAERNGSLPAAWFDALEKLAGRPLPRSAFSFKGAV